MPRKKWKKDHFWWLFPQILSLRYKGRFPHSFTITNETNNTRTSGSQVKFPVVSHVSDWWWGFFLGKIYGPYKEITNMAKSGKFSFSVIFQDQLWTQTVTCLAINSQTRSQKGIQVQSTRADGDAWLLKNCNFVCQKSKFDSLAVGSLLAEELFLRTPASETLVRNFSNFCFLPLAKSS